MPRRTRRITQPHAEVGESPIATESSSAIPTSLHLGEPRQPMRIGGTDHMHDLDDRGCLTCPECIAVLTAPEQP